MRIEQVQRASAQFENLNGRLGPAVDPNPFSLARWTCSISIQLNGTWKGIGGVIIGKASFRAADSLILITIVSL